MAEDTDWESIYARKAFFDDFAPLPWEIGEIQPALAAALAASDVRSPVLDAGCGIGVTSAALAQSGHEVVGADISSTAIARARERLPDGASVRFVVGDITELPDFAEPFQTVVDSTLFHSIPTTKRTPYLARIHDVCAPGAQLLLLTFSDRAPFPDDMPDRPNVISDEHLGELLESAGWGVERIEHSAIEAFMPDGYMPGIETAATGRVSMPALLAHGVAE